MSGRRDYYKILHVHSDADPEIIKVSYRTLMQKLKLHPDLGGDQAEAALINEAYSVLSNPSSRAHYDKLLGLARQPIRAKPKVQPKKTAKDTIPANKEKLICLFCKQSNIIAKLNPSIEELHCFVCQSPLRFIDFDPQWVGHRAARSARQNVELEFNINHNAGKKLLGQVEDLSPTGMRFSSDYPLRMGNIIKMETRELSAVGSVMRCEEIRGKCYVGVKFLSLKIHKARGTFISQRV